MGIKREVKADPGDVPKAKKVKKAKKEGGKLEKQTENKVKSVGPKQKGKKQGITTRSLEFNLIAYYSRSCPEMMRTLKFGMAFCFLVMTSTSKSVVEILKENSSLTHFSFIM